MNLKIRESIINNTKDDAIEELINTLNETVNQEDEIALPGLGVYFELLWNKSNENEKKEIIEKIKSAM